ncbi:MAG: GreA/GreB family elongation factor [Burkholderiales bacterium]
MSRAFVREQDGDSAADEYPERPQSPHPNYLTAAGYSHMEKRKFTLQRELESLGDSADAPLSSDRRAQIERDLRYLNGRLERAIVVDVAAQPVDEVYFGARVEVLDENNVTRAFTLVGEDEADVAGGRVSWISPLGQALMGARVGDSVSWKRPAGNVELEIRAISYLRD